MSVNGVTGVTSTYAATDTATATAKVTEKPAEKTAAEDKGVVYEPSSANAKDGDSAKVTDYSSIVANMKKELTDRNKHLQDLVNQLLTKQAGKYTSLADMFKNLNADPATVEQAQKDISEDGYWGVNQTSDRLVSMAQALSNGDPSKADEMINAIKKGFSQASKDWGDDLPDISKKTVDAAIEKLSKWRDDMKASQTVVE